MLTAIEDYCGYSLMLSHRGVQELPQHLIPSLSICLLPSVLLLLFNLIYPLLRLPAWYLL
jgi:hypothetical protein